jgi:hypothetical protein
MYKLRLSLLAVLCVSAVLNAGFGEDADRTYNLIVRDARGTAAAVYYVGQKVSVVDQLPGYVKNNPLANNTIIKKADVDRALLHVAANVTKRACLHGDSRVLSEIAKDSAKDAAISLTLSALWNTADRMRLAGYFKLKSDSEVANIMNSVAYGLIHGACRVVLDGYIPSK